MDLENHVALAAEQSREGRSSTSALLDLLRHNAARKSDLDADKELMRRAVREILHLRRLIEMASPAMMNCTTRDLLRDEIKSWAATGNESLT